MLFLIYGINVLMKFLIIDFVCSHIFPREGS